MASRQSSVQKSLIKIKDESPMVEQSSPRDSKKRVSWGNQKVRTYLKDTRYLSDRESYNLIEPGEAEHPISSQESQGEAMSIDQDFPTQTAEVAAASNVVNRLTYRGLFDVDPNISERMDCDESPMSDNPLVNDRGVSGRHVKLLEDTPRSTLIPRELTPVQEESEPMALESTAHNLSVPKTHLVFTPISQSSSLPPADLREPLRDIPASTELSYNPRTPNAMATYQPDLRRETNSAALQRPETPRKYVSSRASMRRNSYNAEAKDTTNPPSIYEQELLSVTMIHMDRSENSHKLTPSLRQSKAIDMSKHAGEMKQMCDNYQAELDNHAAFLANLSAETAQIEAEIALLLEESNQVDEVMHAHNERLNLEAVVNKPSFACFLRELKILKEIIGWKKTCRKGHVTYYKRTSRSVNKLIYDRYKLKINLEGKVSASLAYTPSNDFANSVLKKIFSGVNSAFSSRVRGLPKVEIKEAALETVENLVVFIGNIKRLMKYYGGVDLVTKGEFVVAKVVFADSVPISIETNSSFQSYIQGHEVSLRDFAAHIKVGRL